jgi:hypothetical protein
MVTIRTILRDLADSDRRRRIGAAFRKHADAQSRAVANAQLAKALHFRDETLRKLPAEKWGELLTARAGSHEFDEALAAALMHYHTHDQREMLAAFLDAWNIPHVNGSIEVDDYAPPTADQVRDAVRALDRFDKRDVAIYLASAALLMGGPWEEATTPVVEELAKELL